MLGIAMLVAACGAGTATAASEVFWANSQSLTETPGPSIGFASLDGTVGGPFSFFPGAPINTPTSLAIDPVSGRVYWANVNPIGSGWTIGWSNLSGTQGGTVAVAVGAKVISPFALAIDPVARRLYWANDNDSSISWAGLDNQTGGTLTVPSGAVMNRPVGLAVDPVGRRLYWANLNGTVPLSFADLDDNGGGSLTPPSNLTSGPPRGLAFDQATHRLYWSNIFNSPRIAFENVNDPTDVGKLTIPSGAFADAAAAMAIDPFARRLYWVDQSRGVSFADLDAATPTGGRLTIPASAPLRNAIGMMLVLAPAPVAPPTISGATNPGAALSCSQGDWAPESLATFPYRGAQTFAYQWSRNGTDIATATNDTLSASEVGDYRCTVTATNALGLSAPQTSAAHTIDTSGSGTGTTTGNGGGTGTGAGPPIDTSLHAPVIDDAPPASTPLSDASLLYHAVDKGVTLSCQLDGGGASACTGRSTYPQLGLGHHCFSVSEQHSGLNGPPAQTCWTVTQLAPGCTASFHHGYFVTAGAATLAHRKVTFHSTTDGVAGRIALDTTSKSKIRVSYELDGHVASTGARATLAYAQLDRTRSHTLTISVTSAGRTARIVRRFRYASFVAIACGGRRVVGRIARRSVRVSGAAVTISAQVPKEIRGTTKLRFLIADRSHVLRAVRFTFAGKVLDQHAFNAALTSQQLQAKGSQTITVALVPKRGQTVIVRIAFRTTST